MRCGAAASVTVTPSSSVSVTGYVAAGDGDGGAIDGCPPGVPVADVFRAHPPSTTATTMTVSTGVRRSDGWSMRPPLDPRRARPAGRPEAGLLTPGWALARVRRALRSPEPSRGPNAAAQWCLSGSLLGHSGGTVPASHRLPSSGRVAPAHLGAR